MSLVWAANPGPPPARTSEESRYRGKTLIRAVREAAAAGDGDALAILRARLDDVLDQYNALVSTELLHKVRAIWAKSRPVTDEPSWPGAPSYTRRGWFG